MTASAFLNPLNIGTAILGRNSSPSKQLLLSARVHIWKRFENCKIDFYGIVKFNLSSSLVVNLMHAESFCLFLSKIYTKGL